MKGKISDKETLKKELHKVLNSNLADFIHSTSSRRAELIGNKRYVALSVFFIVSVVFSIYFININLEETYKNILLGCMLLWILVLLLSGRKWMTNTKLLAREMNMALVPILTNTFDRMLMYTNNTGHASATEQLLSESKLFTDTGLVFNSDDMYSIYGSTETTVRELSVYQKITGADGKVAQTELFKGVFVVAQLSEVTKSPVYISTEGDGNGFSHQSFWSHLLESGEVKEIDQEGSEFAENVHVAAADFAVAAKLVTPAMMEVIHDWWMEHKLNMRIAFVGNKMYLLLPGSSIHIASSTTSIEPAAVEHYAWAIAQPIWRSLLLIDEAQKK